ncbi:MAG: putative ABC transporter permease subunit [Limisphaerales bacterium]
MAQADSNRAVLPLRLLLRVNLLQSWRRLCSVRDQSSLLTAVIVLFIGGYIVMAFGLFYRGLKFIGVFPGIGELLIERLLFLLFAFLFMLLLFSNLVIGYSNFFRNRETAFLLTLPVPAQTVFRWKFVESALLASWAFLFLIAPLLGAYGMWRHVPWHFYGLTVVLVGLFIVLPAVFGAWAAVNLARFLDRRAFQTAAVVAAVILFFAIKYYLRPEQVDEESLETRVLAVLDRLLAKTRFAQFPFLPSYWLSASVQHWAEGARAAAGFFLLVLVSHVLFFGALAATRMGNLFYDATSVVHSRASVFGQWEWFRHWQDRRRVFHYRAGWLEMLFRLFAWLPGDVRALMVKDVRMFWRDTTQWGQSLMLFGLLGVYILNLRHFTSQISSPFWLHLISYLNLAACSLNLATLTTRFVFPQFSLEGKRLWIVGRAPLGLPRGVQTKFLLVTSASLVVTLGMIALSCHMLQMPAERTAYFAGAITVMTLTLNALALGIGVLYPNLREDNPSKIVSGFGGTFALVMSFLYIVASVLLLAWGSPWRWNAELRDAPVFTCFAGFIALSFALGYVPFRLALRRLRNFEH